MKFLRSLEYQTQKMDRGKEKSDSQHHAPACPTVPRTILMQIPLPLLYATARLSDAGAIGIATTTGLGPRFPCLCQS